MLLCRVEAWRSRASTFQEHELLEHLWPMPKGFIEQENMEARAKQMEDLVKHRKAGARNSPDVWKQLQAELLVFQHRKQWQALPTGRCGPPITAVTWETHYLSQISVFVGFVLKRWEGERPGLHLFLDGEKLSTFLHMSVVADYYRPSIYQHINCAIEVIEFLKSTCNFGQNALQGMDELITQLWEWSPRFIGKTGPHEFKEPGSVGRPVVVAVPSSPLLQPVPEGLVVSLQQRLKGFGLGTLAGAGDPVFKAGGGKGRPVFLGLKPELAEKHLMLEVGGAPCKVAHFLFCELCDQVGLRALQAFLLEEGSQLSAATCELLREAMLLAMGYGCLPAQRQGAVIQAVYKTKEAGLASAADVNREGNIIYEAGDFIHLLVPENKRTSGLNPSQRAAKKAKLMKREGKGYVTSFCIPVKCLAGQVVSIWMALAKPDLQLMVRKCGSSIGKSGFAVVFRGLVEAAISESGWSLRSRGWPVPFFPGIQLRSGTCMPALPLC